MAASKPQAVIHIDLAGIGHIFRYQGWDYRFSDDPVFETGFVSTAVEKGATGRSKSGPVWFGEALVPVVHGRAPCAARRAFQMG